MNSNIGKTQWEIGWLYQQRQQREAQRQRRGRRYALAEVLLWVALSKVCGADETHGVAAWVQLRQEALRRALDGQRDPFPHASPYGRSLAKAVDVAAFEAVVVSFCNRG